MAGDEQVWPRKKDSKNIVSDPNSIGGWHRQHPLAHWQPRHDVIGEMRCSLHHPPGVVEVAAKFTFHIRGDRFGIEVPLPAERERTL